MVHLDFINIQECKSAHYIAVEDYVKSKGADVADLLYKDIAKILGDMSPFRPDDYNWLKKFILADVETLEKWVQRKEKELQIGFFKELYTKRFSTNDKYVDSARTYNAYTLLRMMDFKVCPYCDDEYFDILHPEQGLRRTSEFDHFYPEGKYPGLAMCFYNLIPSGKCCNQLMNKYPVSANPYHPDIEDWSMFESNIPFGSNLESLPLSDFSATLRVTGRMIQNNKTLALEEHYNNRKEIIRKFLLAARDYEPEKVEELIRLGVPIEWIQRQKQQILGAPYPQARGKEFHQKLRHDLTGY